MIDQKILTRIRRSVQAKYSMRYHEITESASPILYHVTWQSRLKAIREHGLIPGKRRNWKAAGSFKPIGSKDHIYLFSRLEDAARWAHKMSFDFQRPVAILACRPSGPVEKDPNSAVLLDYRSAARTDNMIPPEQITGVTFPDSTLYRQIVNDGTITEQPNWISF